MIKKVILFIGVSTLFIVLFAQVNGMKASSKIGQDTADVDDWQQNKTNMKVHKGCNCSINWDSIHAIYAAKDYQLADEWQFRDFYVGSEDSIESGKRSVLWDMKIKLVGDSILYLNNKKVKVRRTNVDASAYKDKSYFDDYLVPFLAYRGINISKSVPVLQLTSSKEDVYSDDLRYIYTGNYLVLKYQGMCTIHKFIGKNSKSLPSPTAKVEYTCQDLYKDMAKEKSSKNAQLYNIRKYKGTPRILSAQRFEDTTEVKNHYFTMLPAYNGIPVFISYFAIDIEFINIFTFCMHALDYENSIEIHPIEINSDATESFAIFTDGTIYVKKNDGKKSMITVKRISKEGDFYELK